MFSSSRSVILVAVLSDTHGHLYPEVMQAIRGADHIIHAGDIGSGEVLVGLKTVAPVTAVRGNCDLGPWASGIPEYAEVVLGGIRIYVGHMGATALTNLVGPSHGAIGDANSPAVVITGHTHKAAMNTENGVLFLNPGAAGPRRFGRPRTIALLSLCPEAFAPPKKPSFSAQIVELE